MQIHRATTLAVHVPQTNNQPAAMRVRGAPDAPMQRFTGVRQPTAQNVLPVGNDKTASADPVKAPPVAASGSAELITSVELALAALAAPGFAPKDPTTAKLVSGALANLLGAYQKQTDPGTDRVFQVTLNQWLALAAQVLATGTYGGTTAPGTTQPSNPKPGSATPGPSTTPISTTPPSTGTAPASGATTSGSTASGATTTATTPAPQNRYSQSALAYEDLPAYMQGGVSPNNGLKVIYVTSPVEIPWLPMWKDKAGAVVDFYSQQFLDALNSGSVSVTGTMGYEIHLGQAKPATSTTPGTTTPSVTDADIKAFVDANVGNPGAIAAAMRQYGVSVERLLTATGYTAAQFADYARRSGSAELLAMLGGTPTTGTNTPTTGTNTPTTGTSTPTTGTGSTTTTPASTHPYSQSAVAYSDLPANMQGGVSPNNGLSVIYVNSASEIALLPMWKDKPASVVEFYSQQFLATLNSGGTSVTGTMGYEIHINQTKPTTAPPTTTSTTPVTTAPPAVTDAQIKEFVTANLSNPGAIAAAMRQYGVSFARLGAATGYSASEIADYVRNSGNADLMALYGA